MQTNAVADAGRGTGVPRFVLCPDTNDFGAFVNLFHFVFSAAVVVTRGS